MGMNSVLIVLNDGLHEISEDPSFGQSVRDAVTNFSVGARSRDRFGSVIAAGSHGNCAGVIASAPSDVTQIVLARGNTGRSLDPSPDNPRLDDDIQELEHHLKLMKQARRERDRTRQASEQVG